MKRSRIWVGILAVLLSLGTAGAVRATEYQDPGGGGEGGGNPCDASMCGCTASGPGVYVCAWSCGCAGGVMQYRSCTECQIR